MTRLEEIEARLKAATPGPWEEIHPNADEGDIRVQVYHAHKRTVVHDADAVAWKLKEKDAAFIANAPADMARLVETVKVLHEALKDIESNYDHDLDAHKYDTPCRCCTAREALARVGLGGK